MTRTKKYIFFTLAICMFTVLMTACSKEEGTKEVTGKTLYNDNCLSCHGDIKKTELQLSLKDKIKTKTVEDIESSILTPPTGMPKMVNEEDAKKLAQWLVEQK